MNPNLPPDLLPRVKQILLPLVATAEDREALLLDAFYSCDPLLYGIDRGGSANVFTSRCAARLIDYGRLSEAEHALARLLVTARYHYGIDKHAEIDELVRLANGLSSSSRPTTQSGLPNTPTLPPTLIRTPIRTPVQTIDTPREDRGPAVFISYFHGDAEFAQQLITDLNHAGHSCWIDTMGIKGGEEWIKAIAEGILNSYALVVIVTRRALESRRVQDEILWARKKQKLIIPLILENVVDEARFFPLTGYQGITLFDSDYATALPKLLRALPVPTLLEVELQDDPADTQIEPISPEPLHSVPRKLELDYLERLELEELLSTEKYTAVGGTSQQKRAEMRAVFELVQLGKDRDRQQEPKRFENAVEEIRRLRRAVLLGEPGGGKTTTIWKLAADLVADARENRKAPIPLLVRLGRWTEDFQLLEAFIASQLGDLGRHLQLLLAEKRAALLLDGLNELPTGQRDFKYPQVQRLIKQHPSLMAVVSCRELDYTVDLGFDRINITPLDPIRIREFARRYLGEVEGDALFWKLAGPAARDTHGRFMHEIAPRLAESERVFWVESQLPQGVYWGRSWRERR